MIQKTLILALLAAGSLYAADDLRVMFKDGKASGEIRAFHIDRAYDGFTGALHRNATAIGGHLKFETAGFEGLSFGTAFYTSNRILRSFERDAVDPSLFGAGLQSETILGEAYLKYKNAETSFVGGRQKIDTPLAGTDDARMLPSLFEAYMLRNTSIASTTFTAGHLTKFAAGSFANAYDGGILGVTSGYTAVVGNAAKYQGEFTDMGTWAVGKETRGVSVISAVYKEKGMKLQAWDYAAWDILNALYLQADMSYDDLAIKPFVGVQAIKEDNIGDDLLKNAGLGGNGEIDSIYWAVKAGAKYEKFTAYLAYSQTGANSDTDATYKNAIVTPWGGMPAFTQGMVTRHMFMAGTRSTKAAVNYTDDFSGNNLSVDLFHVLFEMDRNGGYGLAHTASESGFDLKIKPAGVKNLLLRLRGNFPNDFKKISETENISWNEYRFIVSYKF